MTCCHFFCSAVFSMPVCRNPIVGEAERIVSPSSSSTSRSTPCVLGCCGPMLTVIVSVRISGISGSHLTRPHLLHHGGPEDAEAISCPRSRRPHVLRVLSDRALVGDRSLYQLTHRVQQRPVDLLHPRRRVGCHVDVDVHQLA